LQVYANTPELLQVMVKMLIGKDTDLLPAHPLPTICPARLPNLV